VQGGVRYVGSRYLNNANTISTPSYTVVDSGVWRRLNGRLNDRVGVDLRFYNLFDEFYAHNIYGGAAAPQWLVGRPRSAEVALTMSF